MMQSTLRPMTESERAAVKNLMGSQSWSFFDILIAFCFGMIPGAVICGILERNGFGKAAQWAIPIGGLFGLIGGYFMIQPQIRADQQSRGSYRDDLNDSRMEVIRVSSSKVVQLEEYEDEGNGYFFDIGEDKILFLQGQYLYEVEDENQFPNDDFELIRTPHSKLSFDVKCHGKKITPVKVLKEQKIKWGSVSDGQVIDGPIESVNEMWLYQR